MTRCETIWSAAGNTTPQGSNFRRTRRHLALASAALLLAGCGASDEKRSDPARAAGAAARTYLADFIDWQAGKRDAAAVRAASEDLRQDLAATRQPPASMDVRREVVAVSPPEVHGSSARVVATIRNTSEGVVYDMPINLRLSNGVWTVIEG